MSYRRDDSAYPAGWLYGRLTEHFGRDRIFKDIDSIEPGDDFVEVITEAVASCQVLLALIGDHWLTATGDDGGRRLDDPHDFVRLEIEAALERNVRVIPVLLGTARVPPAKDLPPSLQALVRRHALVLSPDHFDSDVSRLLPVLDAAVGAPAAAKAVKKSPPPSPAPPAKPKPPTTLPAAFKRLVEELGRLGYSTDPWSDSIYYVDEYRHGHKRPRVVARDPRIRIETRNKTTGKWTLYKSFALPHEFEEAIVAITRVRTRGAR